MKKNFRLFVSGMFVAAALAAVAGGETINVTAEGRTAFRRGESPATVRLKMKNISTNGLVGELCAEVGCRAR